MKSSYRDIKKVSTRESGNLSCRFQFYSYFIIEKLKNTDHILSLLREKGIVCCDDINRINPCSGENLNFARSYNSLRKRPVVGRSISSVSPIDKELRHSLEREFGNRSLRKSTLLLQTIQEKVAAEEKSIQDNNIFHDVVNIFHETQNGFIAELLHVDPNYVPIGRREWEKIVLELWDDLVSFVDYDLLAPYLMKQNVLSRKQHKHYVDNIKNREDRVANLLLFLSDRYQGLKWLTKALQNEGSVHYSQLAQLCTLLSDDESSVLNCHKKFIVGHIDKVVPIVNELYSSGGINSNDRKRICNPSLTNDQMKDELLRTLNRKRPGIVDLFKECCNRTKNIDIAVILNFNPSNVFNWEEVEKLKLDWDYIVNQVSYEDIYRYFIHRGFIDRKEHEIIQNLPDNSDKIRLILGKLPTRNGAYVAFFQILALKEEYEEIIHNCMTMDFEETRRLLEVQDFLWEHLENMELIMEKLIALNFIDNQEANFIIFQPNKFERNFVFVNTMKQKGPGTVDKLVEVFSMTKNRNSSEILSVDFQNLKMTTEEWTKLKVHWCKFVNKIRYKSISSVLMEAGFLSVIEHKWILKSEKNRQRMRKLLRIIPAKKDGYKMLLSTVSTVKDPDYQKLVLDCAPMCPADFENFYINIYDFLLRNTRNINVLLKELEDHSIISPLQRRIMNCYNDNCQVEELYILFLGKDRDIFKKMVSCFTRSGNDDVAAVLTMDMQHMMITVDEWKSLTKEWGTIVDIVDYEIIRESCTVSQRFLSAKDDREIMGCRSGPDKIRKLLQIIPFRNDGFRNFASVLMKNAEYEHIAWNLMTTVTQQKS